MPYRPEDPDAQPSGDYEYDLAHEVDTADMPADRPAARSPVYVATETSDHDEDYTYDLAHDVPPQRRD